VAVEAGENDCISIDTSAYRYGIIEKIAYHGGQSAGRPSISDVCARIIASCEYSLEADALTTSDDIDSPNRRAPYIRGAMACCG
jgi:hypothetical protein